MASTVQGAGAVEGPSHPALERLVRRPWEGAGRLFGSRHPRVLPQRSVRPRRREP